MKKWSWSNLLLLFLTASLVTGCRQRAETLLRGYAEEVVLELDFEILHEEHRVVIAPFDADIPSSRITSTYQVSEKPAEIIERLNRLHHTDKAWLKYESGQWFGEVPLIHQLNDPEEEKDDFRYYLPSRPGSSGIGPESLLDIDYLLMCPWIQVEKAYHTLYEDAIILTEEGKLVIVMNASGWSRLSRSACRKRVAVCLACRPLAA